MINFTHLGARTQAAAPADHASGRTANSASAEAKRAAMEFEAIMLSQMTAALRTQPSDNEDSLFGSGDGDLAQQMFGEQLAMSMAKGGGIGLAELIARDMNPAKGEAAPAPSPLESAIESARHLRGPLPSQPPINNISPQPPAEDVPIRTAPAKPVNPLLEVTRPRRVSDLLKAEPRPDTTAASNAVNAAAVSNATVVKIAPPADTQPIKRAFESPARLLSEPSLTGQPKVDEIIQKVSARHGIDPHLVAAILRTESSGKQNAVSNKGASGYMQIMPATFKEFAEPGQSIFDAKDNIGAGASYLKYLSDRYGGKIDKMLAAYNAGTGNVEKYGGIPPFKETRNFVATVKRRYKEMVAATEGSSASGILPGKGELRVKYEATSARSVAMPGSRDLVTAGRAPRAERQVIVLRNDNSGAGEMTARSVDLQVPTQGRISSPFGAQRNHGHHKGVDIAAPRGTPIEASAEGEVVFSGWSRGYGKTVLIKHQEGFYTRYAHADNLLVSRGDTVQAGQQVATVGATGHATGPHLHFEVIKGSQRINPLRAVADNSAQGVAIKIDK